MNIVVAPKIHGLPDDNLGFKQESLQGNTNECAIWSQWHVLRDYGINVDEKILVEQARANGWFTDDGGTPSDALGKLLVANGVPCDMMVDGNRYNLMNELAQGKRVIVTVDANELWRENTALARLWEGAKDVFGSGENHACVVSGIDTSDPNNIQVVLTDSGSGHRTISYPIEQFEDAWSDGGCKMIVTRNPPPPSLHLPSMLNFDYGLGHIPMIGDSEFSAWQDMHSDLLDDCSVAPIASGTDGVLLAASTESTVSESRDDILEQGTSTIISGEDVDDDGNVDIIHVDVDGDGCPDITINLNGDDIPDTLFGGESADNSGLS